MRKDRCPDGVKVARFPGMSEVSGWILVSGLLFSIDRCCIYLVFTMLFIFVKRMYIRGARPLCKGSTLSRHVRRFPCQDSVFF